MLTRAHTSDACNNFSSHSRIRLEFDHTSFCPIHLADARTPEQVLFAVGEVRYETSSGEHFAETADFELVSHSLSRRSGQSTLCALTQAPHLRISKKFVVDDKHPWLRVQYSLQTTGLPVSSTATQLAVPAWSYGDDLENPLEADLDDYSFGRILPDGYESPPYLTFWQRGHEAGLLLWTQNREMMRRVRPMDRALMGLHPALSNGSSSLDNPLWDETTFQNPHLWDFYLWPVQHHEWKAATETLQEMRFRSWNPQRIAFPRLPETSRRNGLQFSAADIARANPDACADTPQQDRWWHVRNDKGDSLLYAQELNRTPPLVLRHELHGSYRIRVIVHGGSGIQMQLQGTRHAVPLFHDGANLKTPYKNALLDCPASIELDAGVWSLNGTPIEVHALPALYAQTIIRDISFEPSEMLRQIAPANRVLCGIVDSPDIAASDSTPTDAPYRANIAHHAEMGFKRVYWRADGQCCDFHTKVGTVRYPVRRVHNLFCPAASSYGRALCRYDLLGAAVEEGHDCGLEVFGYMRLNGFKGNVTAQFFHDHPELRDVTEDGKVSKRMCYYLPEFRQWKVEIAREIVRHGVDGLLLDLMRSPPMIDYHPTVIEAYRQKYSSSPPRNPGRGFVSYGVHPLETDEEWLRWWRFRAEGFTNFGREIRAMLAEEGKPDLPIHVQVRPTMALFDGFDLPVWIEEQLFNTLLVWPGPDLYVPSEVFETCSNRLPVRCTVDALSPPAVTLEPMMQVLGDARFEGLNIYESNAAVWSPLWREAMAKLLRNGSANGNP